MAKKLAISGFVDFLEQQYIEGAGYIMASLGENPRTGYLDLTEKKVKPSWREDGWYYTQYSGAQREQALKWRKQCKRVFDCQGLSEGYYEIMTGVCVNTQAKYNYSTWCSPKGTGIIPKERRVPGAAVFWGSSASSIHHVAYLYKPVKDGHPEGDWYIIEARGVMYGVVKTKLLSRKPTHWGLMTKYFDYDNTVVTAPVQAAAYTLGSRDLKNGSEGDDVKEMQSGLIRLGYDLGKWGADGDFGDCTEIAVRAFQKDHDLTIDGVFGEKTYQVYEAALIALGKGVVESPTTVQIVGGNCYIRTEGNTNGKILGVAREGTEFKYAGETNNIGWQKIEFSGGVGWVSGKYGKLKA